MNYFMLFYRAVFITVFCFGRLPQMDAMRKKKWLTSTYFQYISAKFTLFWFWPQPIRRHETDILPMVMARTACGLLHMGIYRKKLMGHSKCCV